MRKEILEQNAMRYYETGRVVDLDEKYGYQDRDIVYTERRITDTKEEVIVILSAGEFYDRNVLLRSKLKEREGHIKPETYESRRGKLTKEIFFGPYIILDNQLPLPEDYIGKKIIINKNRESEFKKTRSIK